MKSKAPLALAEQIIMMLVFAVAAAVCLSVFVHCDAAARENRARDFAAREAQNAAEVLKACRGDVPAAAGSYGGADSGEVWDIYYDESGNMTADADAEYRLCAEVSRGGAGSPGSADVSVTRSGEPVFSMRVCWQEVAA